MRIQQKIIYSQRLCGWFFIFLGVASLVLSGVHFYLGRWILAASLLPGVPFCIWVGRLAIAGSYRKRSIRWRGWFTVGPPTDVERGIGSITFQSLFRDFLAWGRMVVESCWLLILMVAS
jgi:hypothetical protein